MGDTMAIEGASLETEPSAAGTAQTAWGYGDADGDGSLTGETLGFLSNVFAAAQDAYSPPATSPPSNSSGGGRTVTEQQQAGTESGQLVVAGDGVYGIEGFIVLELAPVEGIGRYTGAEVELFGSWRINAWLFAGLVYLWGKRKNVGKAWKSLKKGKFALL